jgi:hypothetical protein
MHETENAMATNASPSSQSGEVGRPGAVGHSSTRWAVVIVDSIAAKCDPKTTSAWARSLGRSTTSLRAICRSVRVECRRSRDLARLLRAVALSKAHRWEPYEVLDVIDSRTMARLLSSGGLKSTYRDGAGPSVPEFLRTQSLVTDGRLVQAIAVELARRGATGAD